MKHKLLYLTLCAVCTVAYASPKECPVPAKCAVPCNKLPVKTVTAQDRLAADAESDAIELSPINLLLIQS